MIAVVSLLAALVGPAAEPEPEVAPSSSAEPEVAPSSSPSPEPEAAPSSEPEAAPSPEPEPEPEPKAAPSPAVAPSAQAVPSPAPEAAPSPTVGVFGRRHSYPDVPIRWRLDVALGGGGTVVTDTSYLAFSDASRHLPALALSVRADVPLGRGRVFLGGGLGYRWGARTGQVYEGVLRQWIVVHDVIASARASVRMVEGVDLYGEAGIGPGIVLSEAMSDDQIGTDRRIVPAFEALGGLALYLPKRWLPRRGSSRVSGGIDLGLGYALHGRVLVRPETGGWDGAIETRSPDLGDVALRGFIWRAGVFIRFM